MYFLNLIFSCNFIVTVETDDNDYSDKPLECFMDHEFGQREIHVDAIYGKPIKLNDSETNEKQSENKNSTIEPVKIKNEDFESSNHLMEYDEHTIEAVHGDMHGVFESLPDLEDACEMYESIHDGNAFTRENSKNNAPIKCKKHLHNNKTELTNACNLDSKIDCTKTSTTVKVNDKQNDECVKDDASIESKNSNTSVWDSISINTLDLDETSATDNDNSNQIDASRNKENTKALDENNDQMLKVQTNVIVKQNNNKNEHINADNTIRNKSIITNTISKTIVDNPLLDHENHFSSCSAKEHSSANIIQDHSETKVCTESLIGSATDKMPQQMKIEREVKSKYVYNNRMQPNSMLKITYNKHNFIDNNQKNMAHGKKSFNKSRITSKVVKSTKRNNTPQSKSKNRITKNKNKKN